ncbi:hypothetical protein ASG60_06480 [Methylobacterium sp. Leaf469]|jgi:hypothetical protein|uniref:hypothetical protein n=1 Tax=unclassified Methylobacterium TaxID=2615210 RepID=UPI0006F366A3|nr:MULTISPECIES: hypothetical protein [unclassified Methylobacterium]USU30769.1 hypothetical protein NG677_15550 [Methylobacterium sp. OTU13CASTA1]KQO72565.1 hypothetical protein ASF22_12570 [Methylobacterium sp. Leaf87]KQP24188.1 hypothetical protein ASF25_08775 [Methylobacterium sp. Leaf100]KQP24474.1 hypothetical protein ASF27_10195 [Methylobacterium sp. Leaf102]KQP60273.1 hypothetical protein ASF52_07965 [Methylobacterium sp. Leaf112]
MTRILLALICVGAVSPAFAQRPSTTTMSCAQAKGIVGREGGIVLGTGGPTYDRFVRDRSFCEITEITIPAFVPAGDTPRCFVGYRCKEPGRGDRFDDES